MTQTLPVICDRCRAEGFAGDEAFSAIPDLLEFEPVPRRARSDGWTPEHQRAFIAALAVTGSPRRAARAIGKAQFGAEQLRKARGARGFVAAWNEAMDLYRDKEMAFLRDNLADLTKEEEARAARPFALPEDEESDEAAQQREYDECIERIRDRLLRARRLFLLTIHKNAEARAAWEVLVGPTDWEKAARLEPQDDEPWPTPLRNPGGLPCMRDPDMLLTAEAGLLPEMTGDPDIPRMLHEMVREFEAEIEARVRQDFEDRREAERPQSR